MSLRLCIVTEAHPFSWSAHYVRAFRALADVRTAGPMASRELIMRWGYEDYADAFQPNDIPLAAEALDSLEEHVPADWQPDAIVIVSGHSGLRRMRPWPCPTAYVSVDTWQQLTDYEAARTCDFTFVAQREFVPHLAATGAPRVSWLPLAADLEAHGPRPEIACAHDIGFVGSIEAVVHQERARLVGLLREHFELRADSRVFGEDYARALAASRIAFNHSAVDELNMRIFEVMAAGRMLLTNRAAVRNGLLDLFTDGEHLVTYDDDAELIDKTRYYLAHDDEREAIARQGRARILDAHSYTARAQAILDTLAPAVAARAGRREARDPRLALLPPVPGRILDLGATLQTTRHAMRATGAACFDAITAGAPTPGVAARYDTVHRWNVPPELAFDTVVMSAAADFPAPFEEQLAAAHRWLNDGGALLLAVTEASVIPVDDVALAEWLRDRGFHVVHLARQGTTRLIRATRRSAMLKPILLDLNARYPIEGAAYPVGYLASLPDTL